MNWLSDQSLEVEPWQVEDYRQLDLSVIEQRLKRLGIPLDRDSFALVAEMSDSPEELADQIVDELDEELPLDVKESDQAYLLIFELWRRLSQDKLCLSIFCDELDYQIFLYDHDLLTNAEPLQEIVQELVTVLHSNSDKGLDPLETFHSVTRCCAHDIETFLIDFISQQIDEENTTYAEELLDSLTPYLSQGSWLKFIKAKLLLAHGDYKTGYAALQNLLEDPREEEDLEFHLEILTLLSEESPTPLFEAAALKTLSLLNVEEDFLEVLDILNDYYQIHDQAGKGRQIQSLIKRRRILPLERRLPQDDPDLRVLMQLFPQEVSPRK
jgi:hypothetical protein